MVLMGVGVLGGLVGLRIGVGVGLEWWEVCAV